MKLLVTILSFILMVISVNMEVVAQEVMLDPEFGENGNIKVDCGFKRHFSR